MLVANRYEIVRTLGQGAFGRTLLAGDRAAGGRSVALKVLDRRGADDWKAHELFEREAAVLRSLRHHGIPEVHEVIRDEWEGAPATFLVMEYVEGTPLAELIEARRTLDAAEVVHIFLEMLGILEYLHGRVPPILHRDIKPSNIILRPDGRPALVDFGSVRRVFLGPDEGGSTVVGTYGYMPYEQYMGQATPASDLYALGATFLHLLTGRPPRDWMTGEGRIEVPDALPGDPRLRPIIARLLRPSPAERYASAREVRQALLGAASGEPGGTAVATTAAVTVGRPRAVPIVVKPVELPPVPRALEGPTAELFQRVAPSAWRLMDSSSKPSERAGLADVLSFAFFSVLTVGVLPLIFFGMARARRRRLRPFFRDGVPATAEVLSVGVDEVAFGEKMARVTYQFEADGAMHRDSEQVLPAIASRWQPGDRVQILYLPDRDYDSVIISTR